MNIVIYKISDDLKKSNINTFIIYLTSIILPLLIYNKYKITIQSISYFALIPFLIVVSIIDFRTRFVYDMTIVSGIIIQSIIFFTMYKFSGNFQNHVKGLLIGIIISFIVAKVFKAIGDGDIGFYGLCCFVLGFKYSNSIFMLSFIIASIFCIFILIMNKISLKGRIPFTPFISLATVIIMLTEYDIVKIYFDILYNNL